MKEQLYLLIGEFVSLGSQPDLYISVEYVLDVHKRYGSNKHVKQLARILDTKERCCICRESLSGWGTSQPVLGVKVDERDLCTYPTHSGPEPFQQCTRTISRDGFSCTVDKAVVHPLWGGLYP